ncbi:MAG: broad-specificity cellobiase [Frankiales bacterium]|nr:broad-specificity cellobiase [Frankiales bacterium]
MKRPTLRYGVATSAFQVEGAPEADGRGPSTWDEFCSRPGAIRDGSDARTACDSYHRFDEDLLQLVDLGVDAYRFSIAWPRVQPTGRGLVNTRGLDYYDGVVDGLLLEGIEPFPTLFHWDLPLPLEEAGGWSARDTALRFVDYAVAVVDRLGDRVSTWATLNEPWCTALLGWASGVFPPGRREPARAWDCAHHLLLGHALGAAAVRAARPGSEVGLVVNLTTVRREQDGDPCAVDVVDAWQNRLWLDALGKGSYPEVLGEPAALRDGDLATIRGSVDWLGINYYTPFRIGAPSEEPAGVGQDVHAYPGAPPFSFRPRGPLTTMGWEVDPQGLVDTLQETAARLPGVPLRVTENGGAFDDDADRVGYLSSHLAALEACDVTVLDYFAWSLLDNFEWAEGWTQRFGLVAVDRTTLQRRPKPSFAWYAEHIAAQRGP